MMEEDAWTSTTDPKEKKRIQNRVAQRVHRTLYPKTAVDCIDNLLPYATGEKLKSRIRHLEEQLGRVASASTYDDPTLSPAIPGVFPTTHSEPISESLGASSSDVAFVGNHAPKSLLGSDTVVESGFNAIPQTSMVAPLNPLSRTPVQVQSLDLEWLQTSSGPMKPVPERTQVHSPSIEKGHRNQDHTQSPSSTSFPQHLGSSDHVWIGGTSGQSSHKMTIPPIAQNTGHKVLPRPDATRLERLNLLVEYSRSLGFSNLNEALLVYYTSDLSKSATSSHEQSLSRVRQLPNFLSKIREHSKNWPTWEQANYVRETLRSAEEIYAEECRMARINLGDQGVVGLTQKEWEVDQMCQITRVLQKEVCSASLSSAVQRTLMHHL